MREAFESYSCHELFHLTLETVSSPPAVWWQKGCATGNLLENLSARRNVREIVFHHGMSAHFCGAPGSQQRKLHCAVASGLNAEGLWQFPKPTGLCVGGVWSRVHANPGTQASSSIWSWSPKPSLNSWVLGWALFGKHIFSASLANAQPLPPSQKVPLQCQECVS